MKKILMWFQKIFQNLWNWITNNEDVDEEKIFDEQPSLEEEINSLDRINAVNSNGESAKDISEKVAEYCDNDVIATEIVFESLFQEKIKYCNNMHIAFCNPQNYSLAYFNQMADHIQNLYEQAFIDFHLHHLSDPSYAQYLMNHCREAASKLHEQYDIYSKEHWFKSDENTYDEIDLVYAK